MGVNQVIINGEEIMNVREDTVNSSNLLKGESATNKAGEKVEGTLDPVDKGDFEEAVSNLQGEIENLENDTYKVSDNAGSIDDADYIPFNDTSDSGEPKKKFLFSSLLTKLKGMFYNISSRGSTQINANDDLDNYKYMVAGTYTCSQEVAETLSHCPVTHGFKMVTDTGNGIRQTITVTDYYENSSTNSENRVWTRVYFNGIQIKRWEAWERVGYKDEGLYYGHAKHILDNVGEDLNDYKTYGTYNWGLSPVNIAHLPEQNDGYMYVLELGIHNGYSQFKQIVVVPSNNNVYERTFDSGSWTDWVTIRNSANEKIHTYEQGIAIPDNSDLNSYTTAGTYYVTSDASGATISNIPLALCGKVLVFNNGNGGIEQFYFSNHSTRIYTRTKFQNDAWTSWLEITASSKPHTYEVGTEIASGSDLNTYPAVIISQLHLGAEFFKESDKYTENVA